MLLVSIKAMVVGGLISLGPVPGADRCECHSTNTHENTCIAEMAEDNFDWHVFVLNEFDEYVEDDVSIVCVDDNIKGDPLDVLTIPRLEYVSNGFLRPTNKGN